MLKKEDFRTLSTSAQAALRKVDKGEKQLDVASQVFNWWVNSKKSEKMEPLTQEPKVKRNTEEDKFEDLSEKLYLKTKTEEAGPDSQKEKQTESPKERRTKYSTEIEDVPVLDETITITRPSTKGLSDDRVFKEQESHELKQGEAGYVKQEAKNAEIRTRRAAFEQETEELYRSGGGRARDKAEQIDTKSEKSGRGDSDENS